MSEQSKANMIGRGIEMLMARLGKRGRRYVLQTCDRTAFDDLFQIAEKAPHGQVWEGGSNWRTFRGPSPKQCRILESTSNNIEEFVDRLEGFVMRGENPTVQAVAQAQVSPYDSAMIERLVAAKVEAILADRTKMSMISTGKISTEDAVRAPAFTNDKKKERTKRAPYGSYKTAREKSLEVYRERCKILGIPIESVKTNASGKINKMWQTEFDVIWADYCAKNQMTLEKAMEIAKAEAQRQKGA